MQPTRTLVLDIDWAPSRRNPQECLTAILCVLPDKGRAETLLRGGAHEPIRGILKWISEDGKNVSDLIVEPPEDWGEGLDCKFDPKTILARLCDLGIEMQDNLDVQVDRYVERETRRLCLEAANWLNEATRAQPERVRERVESVVHRIERSFKWLDEFKKKWR